MKRLKRLLRTRRRRLIAGGLLLIIIALAAAYGLGAFDKETPQEEAKTVYYSQLTGLEVDRELAERPILGIMIENSEQARPQTGLDSAGIVFETVTEGGITRYLALYQEKMPEIVGPVRSVRPHFVDWLMGFEASVAHVGGSAEALDAIEDRDAKTLSQFKYTEPYYRDNSRAAPHNMYARTKDLRELQEKLDHEKSSFSAIPRSSDNPRQEPDATKITVNFSSPLFIAEFRYDKSKNSYVRYLGGQPHIDKASGKPITVKNLIVLKMPTAKIKTLSNGEALVFKNGTVQKAKWKQTSYDKRLMIIDATGKEVPLNRGDSWFAAVPATGSVTH
ncbi:MAG TPA: DUF3048 domain-containing protein [Candidatus Saccharimonadales bacterium]|nr:DUF3048 domain-containing protein [Candidatus Saccharimonadales bacterium]